MMNSFEFPTEICEWVSKAWNADTQREHGYYTGLVCERLKSNRDLVKPFTERYLNESTDDGELGNALGVLMRIDIGEMGIVPIVTHFIRQSSRTIQYKRDAICILARLANKTPASVYRNLMKHPEFEIRWSVANGLLANVSRIANVKKAYALAKLALGLSAVGDERRRIRLLGSVITFGNEESLSRALIYEYAFNRFTRPHYRAIMYDGLVVAAPDIANKYKTIAEELGNESWLANWYLMMLPEMMKSVLFKNVVIRKIAFSFGFAAKSDSTSCP